MAFAFLLLLTAVLFARPGELLPVLIPLHPYELTIITCMILGFDRLIDALSIQSLTKNPIILCIVGLFSWTVLVEVIQLRLDTAYVATEDLTKVLIYVLLLVGLIDRPSRLRLVFNVLAIAGIINLTCAILNFHEIYRFEYLTVTEEFAYFDGEMQLARRMGASTIFGDPNDLALFISECLVICIFLAWDGSGLPLFRGLWLIPTGLLLYAMSLTQSRGGFVSLMVGITAMIMSHFGRRSLLILVPIVPIGLAFFAGRQASIDLGDGSGQARVILWNGYFELFRGHPLLGVGWEQGPSFCIQQAHNSYLQAYGEQGFLAGTLFLGILMLAAWALTRPVSDPGWARLRPCLIGLVAAQMVGMMGLTRNLALPTFTVIGMAAVYLRSAGVASMMLSGGKLIRFLLITSIGFLVFMRIIIMFNLRG